LKKGEYYRRLYRKYEQNQCSPAEVDELLSYLKSEGFDDIYDFVSKDSANKKYPADPILGQRLEQRLQNILSQGPSCEAPVKRMLPFRRVVLARVAAAVVILLIVVPATYFYLGSRKNTKSTTQTESVAVIRDILPGTHKPVLTLATGQQIVLDSTVNKTLSTQPNTNIVKASSDQLAYEPAAARSLESATTYNTLTNPRGSTVVHLSLSDGTTVWLNAGSSITYPISFNAGNRDVEITGEAYFEVTKNPHKPFTVKKKNSDTKVTVLGTHFNVNMYDDEPESKITLLEGSVKVSSSSRNLLLTPGEQASVSKENMSTTRDVNIEAVMAWKNGQFLLKSTDLAQLLRQVSRWYDVDIENNNKSLNIKFGGSIARSVSLSTVMEALKINGVKCSLEGKKLVVE